MKKIKKMGKIATMMLIIGLLAMMFLPLSVIASPASLDGTPHQGEITSDETWYAADNPHIVIGDVDVGWEATLTLEPGVVVKFNRNTHLRVGYSSYGYGALVAEGTADSMITFTSNLGDPAAGDWDGIIFDECTIDRETLLDHCLIEYGGENGKGNVYCRYASPTITNCTIRDSSTYGVYSTGDGFTEFSNNTITSNALHPLSVDGEYVRTLGSGNTLTGNTNEGIRVAGHRIYTTGIWLNHGVPYIIATDLDIGGDSYPVITIEPGSTLEFRRDKGIRVGYSSYGYGALVAEGTADSMITFTSDQDEPAAGDWDGIMFDEYTLDAAAMLNHCVIEYGGKNDKGNVYCRYASPTITNCTIRDSSTYGVYSTGDGFTEFSNNTITSNTLYPLSVDGEYVRTLGSGNTLTGNTNEGIRVAGHRIYTTGIWLNQGVPYIIATDLDIGGDSYPEITIEPGNALKFEPSRGIRVGYSSYGYGALLAEGTADSMITFTTNFPYPAPGKWDGITFSKYTLDAVAILDHCLIEYGGGNGKGNIYCYYASPTITNCTITNSSHWGIYLDHSNPTMADNEFADNVDGDIGP